MSATLATAAPVAPSVPRRGGELALLFQEAFTVAARVRSNRQSVVDAGAFRAHIKQLLTAADRDARQAGYAPDLARLAVFAYIAFLDESVLNSPQPSFAGWARQPLQEEVFGEHVAGETFFRYLGELLARPDSDELADVLEVFQICLLLGFRGKYGTGGRDSMHGIVSAVEQKLQRIRGGAGPLSPAWAPPTGEVAQVAADPWVRRLGVFAVASLVATGLLFVMFRVLLSSGAHDIQSLVTQLVR
ncbi:MAG TPA: DotU family type IV/VI secretion system protein [Longimicrobiales bacterium]|nr:DotU family type IV/VI secretion system protein [Longimicrobiales bacterium]